MRPSGAGRADARRSIQTLEGKGGLGMEETMLQLANDIASLKWILGAVSVLLLIVTALLIYAFKLLIQGVKNTELES